MIHFNLIRSSVPTEFILAAPDGRTQVFSTRVSTGHIGAPGSGVYSFFTDPENSVLAELEACLELPSEAVSMKALAVHKSADKTFPESANAQDGRHEQVTVGCHQQGSKEINRESGSDHLRHCDVAT